MALTHLFLIDNVKGREAMIGWVVKLPGYAQPEPAAGENVVRMTSQGTGVIKSFHELSKIEGLWTVKVETEGEIREYDAKDVSLL